MTVSDCGCLSHESRTSSPRGGHSCPWPRGLHVAPGSATAHVPRWWARGSVDPTSESVVAPEGARRRVRHLEPPRIERGRPLQPVGWGESRGSHGGLGLPPRRGPRRLCPHAAGLLPGHHRRDAAHPSGPGRLLAIPRPTGSRSDVDRPHPALRLAPGDRGLRVQWADLGSQRPAGGPASGAPRPRRPRRRHRKWRERPGFSSHRELAASPQEPPQRRGEADLLRGRPAGGMHEQRRLRDLRKYPRGGHPGHPARRRLPRDRRPPHQGPGPGLPPPGALPGLRPGDLLHRQGRGFHLRRVARELQAPEWRGHSTGRGHAGVHLHPDEPAHLARQQEPGRHRPVERHPG